MKLIGFNYHKIKAEKLKDASKETKATTNIDILDMSSLGEALGKEKGVLKVDFNYSIKYSPEVANLGFEGNVLLSGTNEEVDKIVEGWKSKKISQSVKATIFNIILRKANVRAIELEDELNLPLHVSMPQVRVKVEPKKE